MGNAGVRISHPNADAARTNFFSNLSGVGTESFESFPAGSTTVSPNFGAAGTATLSGGTVQSQPSGTNGAGRYPISGNQFYETSNATFTIAFNQPIAAFGFYGIDIGDFGGQLTLHATGGGDVILTVPNNISSAADGSVLYFGFYDTAATYTSISFGNTAAGTDFFGFDDFSIGSTSQVVAGVPEPGTLLLCSQVPSLVSP
jgi:hypothetical protein